MKPDVQQIAAQVLSEYNLGHEDIFHAATRIAEQVDEAEWLHARQRQVATIHVSPPSNPPTYSNGLAAGYAEGLRDGRRGS